MVFHKKSIYDNDTEKKTKHYERATVIPRKRAYDFEMVTLKNLLYLTTGQALMTNLGQIGQISKPVFQIICSH